MTCWKKPTKGTEKLIEMFHHFNNGRKPYCTRGSLRRGRHQKNLRAKKAQQQARAGSRKKKPATKSSDPRGKHKNCVHKQAKNGGKQKTCTLPNAWAMPNNVCTCGYKTMDANRRWCLFYDSGNSSSENQSISSHLSTDSDSLYGDLGRSVRPDYVAPPLGRKMTSWAPTGRKYIDL